MSKHGEKLSHCANCQTALEPAYEFCPICGQENHDIKVPITHLGYEFLEGLTHFDSKTLNTLKAMFTKPGLVTKEFLEGKRVKYVPPPRFYIFISVIFFLLMGSTFDKAITNEIIKNKYDNDYIAFTYKKKKYEMDVEDWLKWMQMDSIYSDSFLVANKNPLSVNYRDMRDSVYQFIKYKITHPVNKKGLKINTNLPDTANADIMISSDTDSLQEIRDRLVELDSVYSCGYNTLNKEELSGVESYFSVEFTPVEIERMKFATDEEIDSILISKGEEPSFLKRMLLKKIDKFKSLDFHGFIPMVVKGISISMFFMMPIIAFITFLFFKRKRKFYVEHLVFSIHMHSFVFLLYTFQILLSKILPDDFSKFLSLGIILSLWVYFIMALKLVFEESYLRSAFKFFAISVIYFLLSFVFSLLSLFYGFISF